MNKKELCVSCLVLKVKIPDLFIPMLNDLQNRCILAVHSKEYLGTSYCSWCYFLIVRK